MSESADPDDDRRVVVIGSGPAGAMAAYELVRAGIPTVMLESGTDVPNGTLIRLNGRTLFRRMPALKSDPSVAVTGDQKTICRANYALGGMSNQWTGAVPRFCPEDFTEGQRLHERYVWPITYAELAPFYEGAERLMCITASAIDVPSLPAGHADYRSKLPDDWRPVQESAMAHGQGFTTLPLADGPPHLLAGRGTAFNSYSILVARLLKQRNFRLLIGAHALRIGWDGAKKRSTYVVYRDRRSGADEKLAAAAFVLGCGAVNSAKLLLNSRSPDFPEGLGNSAGLLGRFLHDHPREWWPIDLDRPASLLSPSAYLTRLPHERSAPLMATSSTFGMVGTKDTIRSRFGLKGTAVGVLLFGTMIPTEKQFVQPASNRKDEFGMPAMNIQIEFDQSTLDNITQARQHLLGLMQEAGFKVTRRDIEPQLHPGIAKHYGGTTRMHASPRYGVTDKSNRLHDVDNVLVVDAGCFTTGVEKNPTLTVMAIAARAASHLARELRAI
jgi:choline dehydrogenase-like flavoprotein